MLTFRFFDHHSKDFPSLDWERVIGKKNLFLSEPFAQAIWDASPENLKLVLVGFYKGELLVGGAMLQRFSFRADDSFGLARKDSCRLCLRVTNMLGKRMYILGNNMLSGEHAFLFDEKYVDPQTAHRLLSEALLYHNQSVKKPCVVLIKDFELDKLKQALSVKDWKNYIPFEVQPAMVLLIKDEWKSFDDYLDDLSTKYRTRSKSARERNKDVVRKELSLLDCIEYEEIMSQLYMQVVSSASFNLFFLPRHHFSSLKRQLGERIKIMAYFLEGEMIGFYSLISNGAHLEAYFLGYHPDFQKDRKIYLNFLLDMVESGITQHFRIINFGRTALEIKSTVGAEPVPMKGLLRHENLIVHRYLRLYFAKFYKQEKWVQRKPFKAKKQMQKLEDVFV